MLVKLLKTDIPKVWESIAPMIEEAVPIWVNKEEENTMVKILESLMIGTLTGWLIQSQDGSELLGMGTTNIVRDEHSGAKTLIIYTLYSVSPKPVASEIWVDGFDTIIRYAKAEGCTSIGAFTQESNVVALASSMNADVSTTYIKWSL